MIISFVLCAIIAAVLGENILLWGVIGAVAGTLIDIDHFLLLCIFSRRVVFPSFKIGPMNREFSKYRNFNLAKNLSHALISLVILLGYLLTHNLLLIPVFFACAAHALCDYIPELWMKISYKRMVRKYGFCFSCKSDKNLEVHGDLERSRVFVLLCSVCHGKIHKKQDPYNKSLMRGLEKRARLK